jgi:predicted DNA-binding WGR domain protein
MLKLYKEQDGELLYWEAWEDGREIIIHWGVVGDRGESMVAPLPEFEPPMSAIEQHAHEARMAGFFERRPEDLFELVIRYELPGRESANDVQRAYAIEELMDETLGWTGNGYCEGNDISDGVMRLYCFVVEPHIAGRTIVEELRGAEFLDGAVVAFQDRDESFVVLWPLDNKKAFEF